MFVFSPVYKYLKSVSDMIFLGRCERPKMKEHRRAQLLILRTTLLSSQPSHIAATGNLVPFHATRRFAAKFIERGVDHKLVLWCSCNIDLFVCCLLFCF